MENNTQQNTQNTIRKPAYSMSVCVKNLPTFADDLWMYRRFSHYGGIHSVRAMQNQESGQCQGLGFVNFINLNDAQSAIAHMNGAFVDGKRLVVEMQRPRRKTNKPISKQETDEQVSPSDE
jgi:RNA recognition motif-containing protein